MSTLPIAEADSDETQPAQAGATPHRDDQLYASLLHGMHAIAQPLTLLQSRLHLALVDGAQREDRRTLLADAAEDLEDLCALFGLMQQLLHTQSVPAQCSLVPLRAVVQALDADAEAVFAGTDMNFLLDLQGTDRCKSSGMADYGPILNYGPVLRIDPNRTRQALSGLLTVARSMAERGSSVVCTLSVRGALQVDLTSLDVYAQEDGSADFWSDSSSPGWLDIRIKVTGPGGDTPGHTLGEATHLYLALARENLVSQQAKLRVSLHPFALLASLPCDAAQTRKTDLSSCPVSGN